MVDALYISSLEYSGIYVASAQVQSRQDQTWVEVTKALFGNFSTDKISILQNEF